MSYFRLQSRGGRFYADLSKYGGPSLKALIPDGERRATLDEDVAADLYNRWKKFYLDGEKRRHLGLSQNVALGEFARLYVRERTERGEVKPGTMELYADLLDRVVIPYFGPDTLLGTITKERVRAFIRCRRAQTSRKTGEPIAWSTVRREVSALSKLFEWAKEKEIVFENPASGFGRVVMSHNEPGFLEPDEAWRLLEAARRWPNKDTHALVATYLYTGMRLTEVIGLEPRDVDWTERVIRVRDNSLRSYAGGGIKHRASLREVPLWPDLAEWLPRRIGAGPLFPARGGGLRSKSGVSELIRTLGERAGIEKRVTTHTLRHTWCAMRLQTLDGGAPVAEYTVMREGGWRGTELIHRIYGHLPKQRPRLAVLTYRPEQVAAALG